MGCRLWGHTESDMTEATQQQQQQQGFFKTWIVCFLIIDFLDVVYILEANPLSDM